MNIEGMFGMQLTASSDQLVFPVVVPSWYDSRGIVPDQVRFEFKFDGIDNAMANLQILVSNDDPWKVTQPFWGPTNPNLGSATWTPLTTTTFSAENTTFTHVLKKPDIPSMAVFMLTQCVGAPTISVNVFIQEPEEVEEQSE